MSRRIPSLVLTVFLGIMIASLGGCERAPLPPDGTNGTTNGDTSGPPVDDGDDTSSTETSEDATIHPHVSRVTGNLSANWGDVYGQASPGEAIAEWRLHTPIAVTVRFRTGHNEIVVDQSYDVEVYALHGVTTDNPDGTGKSLYAEFTVSPEKVYNFGIGYWAIFMKHRGTRASVRCDQWSEPWPAT